MENVFSACRNVAEREIRPLHYVFMARRALSLLNYSETELNWQRQIEDVREKLLLKGRLGFGYLRRPYCLAYLREWLDARILFNPYPPLEITPSLQSSLRACEQVALRKYIDKTSAPKINIARGRSRGLLIEAHVRMWFESQWPDYVLPPDNEGQWVTPCDHDFKLRFNDRIIKVDVAGPRASGQYGYPFGGGKHSTDVHILASIDNNSVSLHGFVYHAEYQDSFSLFETRPIQCLIFRLNCLKSGIDYSLFK